MKSNDVEDPRASKIREHFEAYKLQKEQKIAQGQKLYAKVKRSSKYFYQNEIAKRGPQWGYPFPVYIAADATDAYCVWGGPGGGYRLSDVNLFVLVNGRELRIR